MGFGVNWERLITTLTAIAAPWIAKAAEELYNASITTAASFFSTLVDWSNGKRLLIKVTSTLDQDALIQVIGNTSDSTTGATDIEGPLLCAAGTSITIGLAWDDWHPYIGVEITTAVAPASGSLIITATVQE